jgi:hypothetical protein
MNASRSAWALVAISMRVSAAAIHPVSTALGRGLDESRESAPDHFSGLSALVALGQ